MKPYIKEKTLSHFIATDNDRAVPMKKGVVNLVLLLLLFSTLGQTGRFPLGINHAGMRL